MYSAPHPDDAKIKLGKADDKLRLIGGHLKNRHKSSDAGPGPIDYLLTKTMYPSYVKGRKTAKFRVGDSCDSCGSCADICPQGAISLQEGRPQWQDAQCQLCLACIQLCPRRAIQYGKGTAKRDRYVHPDYQGGDLAPRRSRLAVNDEKQREDEPRS